MVVAVSDLTSAVREIGTRFGLAPAEGGRHPGRGYANSGVVRWGLTA